MNDEKIVALYYARDEEALKQTELKYGAYLRAIAKGLLGDGRDREECVNDTFLGAWNTIPPQKPESLKTYLAALCRRTAINKLVSNGRQKRGGGSVDTAFEELESCLSGEDGDEIVDAIALRAALNAFVRGLTRTARAVFVQRYWYMRSCKEIATDLSISENAVNASLHRTRAKLQEYLRKEGFEL